MIVVDMDMPKTCGTCKLSVGYTCTKWLKLYPDEMASKKADDCPIVSQIPQKHGRLIDYGYVVDAIDDWVNAEEYRYTNATDYLRKRVANTPTIIEADRGEEE